MEIGARGQEPIGARRPDLGDLDPRRDHVARAERLVVDESLLAVDHPRESMPIAGSKLACRVAGCETTIANVGGAGTSR
jgi:hypothetical protein